MDQEQCVRQRRKEYEQVALAYLDAFEQGDSELITSILREAENDPVLEKLIWDVHAQYQSEREGGMQEKDKELVQQFLRQNIVPGQS